MTNQHNDPERLIDLDLVRCTENAALAAWEYFGRGDKNAADGAASNAIRGMFQRVDCKGLMRIGEGRKDEAPGIFEGERLGSWRAESLPMALAVDPIDGTTLVAKGLPGAISVLAASICENARDDPSSLFPSIGSHYMEKIAAGPAVAEAGREIELGAPLEQNLAVVAAALGKRIAELVAVVLDRPRHQSIVETLRQAGCRVHLISDGDVAAAIAPSLPGSGVDIYVGIGGSPEAVLSAVAIKCLGGVQLSRMWTKNEVERQRLLENAECAEANLQRIWTVNSMIPGNHLIFAATGISDSAMLRGIDFGHDRCRTHSILIRSRNRTVRRIEALHDVRRKIIGLSPTVEDELKLQSASRM
jgi:fructose-1,6-bisphosphatase II